MHSGDPKGQLTEENRGDRPCLNCHTEYQGSEATARHTMHKPDSPGSRCYNCHMPRVVYGVMSVHPTHQITVPSPAATASASVPNACNQCHLDKSVNWAIAESKRLWPVRYQSAYKSADDQFDLPEGPRALFAGDALTRALAAEAIGGGGPIAPDKKWAAPFLVEALSDSYPIVRFFAADGLATMSATMNPNLPKPDYLTQSTERQTSIDRWRAWLNSADRQRAIAFVEYLKPKRRELDVEVGE